MDQIVLRFLRDLARIDERYPQLYETDVQECIHSAILEGFVKQTAGYSLPSSFEMLEQEADALVRDAVERFLIDAKEEAQRAGCVQPEDRIASVTNADVPSPEEGGYYANFFRDTDHWPV